MTELLARHRQLLLFLLIGGASALIDVGLMQGLILAGLDYVTATTAGFAAGLAFNYTFHARYTFRASVSGATLARYLCVVAFNYLLTLACVAVSVRLFADPLPGKIAALCIVPVNGFLLGKYWIFK